VSAGRGVYVQAVCTLIGALLAVAVVVLFALGVGPHKPVWHGGDDQVVGTNQPMYGSIVGGVAALHYDAPQRVAS
jgi:hypothetical protein